MVVLSLLLLPEWERYRGNWDRSRIKCIIFGSFLNIESLELAHKLTHICTYNSHSLPEKICIDREQILLIFFPISRKLQENFELKDRIEDIIQDKLEESDFQSVYQNIITRAHEIVERNKREYLLRNQWQHPDGVKEDPDDENRFMFGPLAAKYLKDIIYFPKILIDDQIYNGIPLNYNVNDFFEKILQTQMQFQEIF